MNERTSGWVELVGLTGVLSLTRQIIVNYRHQKIRVLRLIFSFRKRTIFINIECFSSSLHVVPTVSSTVLQPVGVGEKSTFCPLLFIVNNDSVTPLKRTTLYVSFETFILILLFFRLNRNRSMGQFLRDVLKPDLKSCNIWTILLEIDFETFYEGFIRI